MILQTASATAAAPETSGKPSGSFGGEAAAQGLDLLGDEGGGGDVGVAEVADLLQGLARAWEGVHVQGRQIDGRGGELLMGAVVLGAQTVNPPV